MSWSCDYLLVFIMFGTFFSRLNCKCSDYNSQNGCKNPLNSVCDSEVNRCLCKEVSLYVNGYCLKPIASINGPCWLSDQCVVTGSKCFTKDGKGVLLDRIADHLWDEFIQSNGSDHLVPGSCQCNIGFVYNFIEAKCNARLIDTVCGSDDECAARSTYSRCIHNKCVCLPRYLYNSRNDKCVYIGDGKMTAKGRLLLSF